MRSAIVACTDSAMLPAALCALQSIGSHLSSSETSFFLVSTRMDASELAEIEAFFSRTEQHICHLFSDDHEVPGREMGRFSQATFMRLSLHRLLPASLDRVLYVDADVLALGDVSPLLRQPLENKAFGAVLDLDATGNPKRKRDRMPAHRRKIGLPAGAPYFNAGCLLMDWKAVKERELLPKARQVVIDRPDLPFTDQDALNLVCQADWLPIEPRWNRVVNRRCDPATAALVHFAGARKPWNKGAGRIRRAYAPIYRRILADTGWEGFCAPLSPLERLSTIPRRIPRGSH